jgi:hypothetical protein
MSDKFTPPKAISDEIGYTVDELRRDITVKENV